MVIRSVIYFRTVCWRAVSLTFTKCGCIARRRATDGHRHPSHYSLSVPVNTIVTVAGIGTQSSANAVSTHILACDKRDRWGDLTATLCTLGVRLTGQCLALNRAPTQVVA